MELQETESVICVQVCHMPGKVLFSSSLGMDRVVELKAAERLFLLLKKDSPLQLSAHTSPGTDPTHQIHRCM